MRGLKQRSWVKIDCYGILHGSINWQLTLEEQALWVKAIAFSAICGATPGIIQDNDGVPLPHEFLAHEFHCPLETFESLLKKCIDQNRIRENEHGIEILNWKTYQFTEYDRQKPYREKYLPKTLAKEEPELNPVIMALSQNYEKEIGTISASIATELTDFAHIFSGNNTPVKWIEEAFAEAAKNNKRSWAYVKAILKSWIEQGKKAEKLGGRSPESHGRRLPTEKEIEESLR